jgi:hypothetical protein
VHTSLTAAASATTIAYGGSVLLSARLVQADTASPLAGRSVVVESRPAASSKYAPAGTLHSRADGSVSFTAKPRSSTVYRFRYVGANGETASAATAGVSVRLTIAGALNAAVGRVGQHLSLKGHVSPALGGYVYRQQLVGRSWTTLARTAVTRTGTFAFPVVPIVKGVKTYRVTMPGSSSYASTVSASMRLTVR